MISWFDVVDGWADFLDNATSFVATYEGEADWELALRSVLELGWLEGEIDL